ncbi:zinc finger, RING/FYVE/PHD-type containing protein, partial [Tanacetum coccineum]
DQFIQREEEEQGKEFEEEAEEDYDYLDYDYDDLEKIGRMVNEPMVTAWCHSDGTTWEEVVICNWPILGRSKNISVFNDVCPICFKALTGSGKHQICCLPCGHIYGRSCIDQWLQQNQNNSKGVWQQRTGLNTDGRVAWLGNKVIEDEDKAEKFSYEKLIDVKSWCPQCKSLCTLKDVCLLQATCPCDAVDTLPKESGKWFPFTKQGLKTFKRYAVRRADDVSGMRLDAARRIIYARWHEIYRRWKHSNGAMKLPDKYYASKFSSLDDKLRDRMRSLIDRIFEYYAGIELVEYLYKKHMKGSNKAKPLGTMGIKLMRL